MRLCEGKQHYRGFTLIELMIVIVIVAILAAVAIPSYQNYVIKSNRSAGKGILMDVVNRQQQFFINTKNYAASLTDLGYSADPFFIDNQAERYGATRPDAIYRIQLDVAADPGDPDFTVRAEPVGIQLKDARCNELSLNSLGQKTATGTGGVDECW